MERFAKQNRRFRRELLTALTQEAAYYQRRAVQLALHSVEARLAAILLELAAEFSTRAPGNTLKIALHFFGGKSSLFSPGIRY